MIHNDNLPQRLVSKLSDDKFVIFLFHGVVDNLNYEIRNYNQKHIETKLFAKCIKLLS